MTATTFDQRIFAYIRENPGVTAQELTLLFPVDSRTYGRQQAVNTTIARLRRQGLLEDVAHRCESCGQATTRGMRNQGLYVQGYDPALNVVAA